MASVKPLPAASAAKDNAATAVNINHIPSFDENGNLITK